MEPPYGHGMVKLGRLQTMTHWTSNTSTKVFPQIASGVQPPAAATHDCTLATA